MTWCAASLIEHFGTDIAGNSEGKSLDKIAVAPYDADRVAFSEYHAAGAVSGAFMVRKDQCKLIRYIDFKDELFDLEKDPEELVNVSASTEYSEIRQMLHKELNAICE